MGFIVASVASLFYVWMFVVICVIRCAVAERSIDVKIRRIGNGVWERD